MAAHCRVCNSTNLDPRVTPPPRNIAYFLCLDCGAKMITPLYDPEAIVAAPELESGDATA